MPVPTVLIPLDNCKNYEEIFDKLKPHGNCIDLSTLELDQVLNIREKIIVVGSIVSLYPIVKKTTSNGRDCQILWMKNLSRSNRNGSKVRVAIMGEFIENLCSLEVNDVICIINPKFCMTPVGVTVSVSYDSLLLRWKPPKSLIPQLM